MNYQITLILICLLCSCNTNSKKQKVKEIPEWNSIFDGKSFNGWHLYNGGDPTEVWSIENKAMKFTPPAERKQGDPNYNIVSDKDYSSFELSLEWKISPAGNSGIFWGVVESEKYAEPYFTGSEIQVLDMGDPKYDPAAEKENAYYEAGALYDLVKPSQQVALPAGEWNHVILHIDHSKNYGFVKLNKVKIHEFPVHGKEWEKMIKSSKFKNWPDFGKARSGKIGFQDHGNLVWYKNIKIRELL